MCLWKYVRFFLTKNRWCVHGGNGNELKIMWIKKKYLQKLKMRKKLSYEVMLSCKNKECSVKIKRVVCCTENGCVWVNDDDEHVKVLLLLASCDWCLNTFCEWPSSAAEADRFPEIKLFMHQDISTSLRATQNRHRSPVSLFSQSQRRSECSFDVSSDHWRLQKHVQVEGHLRSFHWANCRQLASHCPSPWARSYRQCCCCCCCHWSSSSASARWSPSSSPTAPASGRVRIRSHCYPRTGESARNTWRACSECSAVVRGDKESEGKLVWVFIFQKILCFLLASHLTTFT